MKSRHVLVFRHRPCTPPVRTGALHPARLEWVYPAHIAENVCVRQIQRFLAHSCAKDIHNSEDDRDVYADYKSWTGSSGELWLTEKQFQKCVALYGIRKKRNRYYGLRLTTMASAMRARWRNNEAKKESSDEAEARRGAAIHNGSVSDRVSDSKVSQDDRTLGGGSR
jgi:hypothetical protein